MAISSYLRECGYDLGGLLPKVYLVHKNALKLSKKAKGLEVSVVSRNDGDIYCVEGQLCTYKQDETYNGKYRFNSTLELTINELYREPFLYGLRTLRTNEYYIIIEDKKGVQYLINPELYTKMSYEYSFSDTSGNNNHIIITYNNLSNYPLLIFEENISDNKSLLNKQCEYNYGQAYELLMFDHKDLKVKDDGVKVDEMYIENVDDICEIDFMKESFSLTESYDGKTFITSLAFNIPLNDQYGWAYRLLEFKDNKYAAILRTTNDNYIIVGVERGLFPSYTIETSEDDNVPNMVKVVFEQRSQYPILYTDEITQYRWVESEPLCFGFDRYQMLVKEKSEDWGETWVVVDPIVKKKGKIIETDSEACKEYQWVEDGEYCDIDNITYIKWENVDGFICEGGNKYHKTRRYVSEDGKSFSPSDEYGRGELIEEDSKECQYVAVRWVNDNDYECYEVNEEYTKYGNESEGCSGTTKVLWEAELVSSNGIGYYESGEGRLKEVIKEDCCECGYREEEWREVIGSDVCGSELPNKNIEMEISGSSLATIYNNVAKYSGSEGFSVYFKGVNKIKMEIRFNGDFSSHTLFVSRVDEKINKTYNTTLGYYVYTNYYTAISSSYVGITFDIPDDGEHFVNFSIRDKSASKTATVEITFYSIANDTDKYSQYNKYLICDDGITTAEEKTDIYEYRITEENCCECGYQGDLTYVFNNEYICGYELGSSYNQTSKYEIWEEAYVCDDNITSYTGNVEYRNPQYSYDCANIVLVTPSNVTSVCNIPYPTYTDPNTGRHIYLTNYMVSFYEEYYLLGIDKFELPEGYTINTKNLFYKCNSLQWFNFGDSVYEYEYTDTSYMFYFCSALRQIDMSKWNFSKVTNMGHMFESCRSLTSLDVSNFDTSNVTNMWGMFYECRSLKSLDVSNFDTSKVTDMNRMFYRCSGLTSLDLSNFDTSKVTDMSYMFDGCSSLISLDLSNFDTSKATNMGNMFGGCTNLKTIYMRGCSQTTIDKINSVKPSNAQIITE